MTGAKNFPISRKYRFLRALKKIRAKDSYTPLVFYCNGHTCAKSYLATKFAVEKNIKNVFVFDAGIFDWGRAHPELTVLLRQSPVKVEDFLTKKELKEKTLTWKEFKRVSKLPNTLTVDIRDPFQRKVLITAPIEKQEVVALDRIRIFLTRKGLKDKHLLFYDSVGKQVRWLQYYLEELEFKNYNFLEGGISSITEEANEYELN